MTNVNYFLYIRFMSVANSIKTVYKDLKPVQKQIAEYLLSMDFEALHATIDEYARRIGTSVASISRFCQKIGYESFQELKISLSREMGNAPEMVLPIFAPDDDPDLSIRKVFSEAATNLQATESTVHFETVKEAAEQIAACDRLYFFGMGGSGGVGKLGEVMFSHIGFSARSISDPYSMLVSAGHMGQHQALIGLSHTGATRAVVDALRIARERKAFTVAITNYASSPLAGTAMVTLTTSCHEHRVHFAQSNSMVAQLTLIRALYILVASRSSAAVAQKVDRIEESVKRNLRIKNKRSE